VAELVEVVEQLSVGVELDVIPRLHRHLVEPLGEPRPLDRFRLFLGGGGLRVFAAAGLVVGRLVFVPFIVARLVFA
jgi:hypothetical protein